MDESDDEVKAPAKGAKPLAPAAEKKVQAKKPDSDEDGPGDGVAGVWCSDATGHKPTVRDYKFTKAECGYIGPDLPPVVTPWVVFALFCNIAFIDLMVNSTNDFGAHGEGRAARWTPMSKTEFLVFIGIIILMGVVKMPSYKDYWDPTLCVFAVSFAEKMSVTRFGLIQSHLHCAPQGVDDSVDKCAKVRGVLNHLQQLCGCLWRPLQHLSYDEMMIKCKSAWARICVRMPMKPIKWGIKVFGVCCSATGWILNFWVYGGLPAPDCGLNIGLTGNQIHLVCRAWAFLGYTLYMDNYFSNRALFQALHHLGFNCVGTARKNRVPATMQLKKSKKSKGIINHCVSTSNPPVHAWTMMDRGVVTIMSTMHKVGDMSTITRRSGAAKEELTAPTALAEYNMYMGGCDMADQLRASYRAQRMRQMRWYMCLFYWALDVMVACSYIIYNSFDRAPTMTHKSFRVQLAMYLIRGNDGDIAPPKAPKRMRIEETLPAFRLNPGTHFPVETDLRRNCVMCFRRTPSVASGTKIQCSTCQKPLHIACWMDWHNDPNAK